MPSTYSLPSSRVDIVGFTNLCSQSTPMQVVAMLDSLYSVFDEVLEEFDV